jgi:hypothetical protein
MARRAPDPTLYRRVEAVRRAGGRAVKRPAPIPEA